MKKKNMQQYQIIDCRSYECTCGSICCLMGGNYWADFMTVRCSVRCHTYKNPMMIYNKRIEPNIHPASNDAMVPVH